MTGESLMYGLQAACLKMTQGPTFWPGQLLTFFATSRLCPLTFPPELTTGQAGCNTAHLLLINQLVLIYLPTPVYQRKCAGLLCGTSEHVLVTQMLLVQPRTA
jgi:hypothetical protein